VSPVILAASAAPSPLWYATRSVGVISLVLLTAVLVLGIATTARLDISSRTRFILHGLHRNLSLLAVVFLALHVVTAVLDPYARLSWTDALVPFVSAYRPLYLGLGVLASELLAAVVVTALTQRWIGRRLFRLVHWAAYLSWPISVVHSLGTGSDVRTGWFYLAAVACVAAGTAVFLAWRLLRGAPERRGVRVAAGAVTAAGVVALGAWSFTGPLQPGWALTAGTPPDLVHSRVATDAPAPAPATALPAGLQDGMSGRLVDLGGAYRIDLVDVRDQQLTLQIRIAGDDAARGTVTIARSGAALCSFDTSLQNPLAGSCAGMPVQLQVALSRSGRATATMTTGAGGSSQ
jgi:methionine sulfoxide reductase heme-binding subunit